MARNSAPRSAAELRKLTTEEKLRALFTSVCGQGRSAVQIDGSRDQIGVSLSVRQWGRFVIDVPGLSITADDLRDAASSPAGRAVVFVAPLPRSELDILFSAALPRGERRIGFAAFVGLLSAVAQRLYARRDGHAMTPSKSARTALTLLLGRHVLRHPFFCNMAAAAVGETQPPPGAREPCKVEVAAAASAGRTRAQQLRAAFDRAEGGRTPGGGAAKGAQKFGPKPRPRRALNLATPAAATSEERSAAAFAAACAESPDALAVFEAESEVEAEAKTVAREQLRRERGGARGRLSPTPTLEALEVTKRAAADLTSPAVTTVASERQALDLEDMVRARKPASIAATAAMSAATARTRVHSEAKVVDDGVAADVQAEAPSLASGDVARLTLEEMQRARKPASIFALAKRATPRRPALAQATAKVAAALPASFLAAGAAAAKAPQRVVGSEAVPSSPAEVLQVVDAAIESATFAARAVALEALIDYSSSDDDDVGGVDENTEENATAGAAVLPAVATAAPTEVMNKSRLHAALFTGTTHRYDSPLRLTSLSPRGSVEDGRSRGAQFAVSALSDNESEDLTPAGAARLVAEVRGAAAGDETGRTGWERAHALEALPSPIAAAVRPGAPCTVPSPAAAASASAPQAGKAVALSAAAAPSPPMQLGPAALAQFLAQDESVDAEAWLADHEERQHEAELSASRCRAGKVEGPSDAARAARLSHCITPAGFCVSVGSTVPTFTLGIFVDLMDPLSATALRTLVDDVLPGRAALAVRVHALVVPSSPLSIALHEVAFAVQRVRCVSCHRRMKPRLVLLPVDAQTHHFVHRPVTPALARSHTRTNARTRTLYLPLARTRTRSRALALFAGRTAALRGVLLGRAGASLHGCVGQRALARCAARSARRPRRRGRRGRCAGVAAAAARATRFAACSGCCAKQRHGAAAAA